MHQELGKSNVPPSSETDEPQSTSTSTSATSPQKEPKPKHELAANPQKASFWKQLESFVIKILENADKPLKVLAVTVKTIGLFPFLCTVLGVAVGAVSTRFWFPPVLEQPAILPFNGDISQTAEQILKLLPKGTHSSITTDFEIKGINYPVYRPVEDLTTLFFEPEEKAKSGAEDAFFVKLQIITFKPASDGDASGQVVIRALSAGSSAESRDKRSFVANDQETILPGGVSPSFVYQVSDEGVVSGPKAGNNGLFFLDLSQGRTVAIVAAYRDSFMTENDGTSNAGNNWFCVEVSNYALSESKGITCNFGLKSKSRLHDLKLRDCFKFFPCSLSRYKGVTITQVNDGGLKVTDLESIASSQSEPNKKANWKHVVEQAELDFTGENRSPGAVRALKALNQEIDQPTGWLVDTKKDLKTDLCYITSSKPK